MKNVKTQSGFTLIELVITVAVVALISTFTLPLLGQIFETQALDSATRQVHSDLRFAQSLAISSGDILEFRVISQIEYEVYNAITDTVVYSSANQKPMQENLSDIRVGLRFSPTEFSTYTVRFDAQGRPSKSLQIKIVEDSTNKSQVIDISQNSGLIMRNNPTCSNGC